MQMTAGIRSAVFVTLVSAMSPSPGYGQAVKPLTAKVQETLMGPTLAGPGVSSRTYLSEDGDHIAVVTAKGSRQVVLLDGVEGPVFDEIPTLFHQMVSVAPQWSPTGGHSAYIGRRGGDYIAVVDGKEAVTLLSSAGKQAMPAAIGYITPAGWMFWFNHDGSRLAYAAITPTGFWTMVLDGVQSPPYRGLDFRQTFMNGKHFVYAAQTADRLWHVVVDGKPGPGNSAVQSLLVTPDGAHSAYISSVPGTPKTLAVLDGVASGQAYFGVSELELSPEGRMAYTAIKIPPPVGSDRGGAAVTVVDGKEVPGPCGPSPSAICQTWTNRLNGSYTTPARHVAWSPDGKGFAYIKRNLPNPGVSVVVNGKPMGQTYSTLTELRWSPDGTRFAYLGTSPTGFFEVIDGQEIETLNDVPEFQWSPDSKRYAFIGKVATVVDGKDLPVTKGTRVLESFQWSSDSKSLAYIQSTGYDLPVVDGQVKPFHTEIFQGTTQSLPGIGFPPLLFSPDGAHLAYLGRTFDATGRANSKAGIVVDGVRSEGPSESYMYPSWSTDSKHFGAMTGTGQGWGAMIDGKMGGLYEYMLQNNAAACRFTDAHTFRFYGIKAGQIYRVTLDVT